VNRCGEKFCSNPEIKNEHDAADCVAIILKNVPDWKVSNCWFHRAGQGCPECGGKVIHASGCVQCQDLACGWSACG